MVLSSLLRLFPLKPKKQVTYTGFISFFQPSERKIPWANRVTFKGWYADLVWTGNNPRTCHSGRLSAQNRTLVERFRTAFGGSRFSEPTRNPCSKERRHMTIQKLLPMPAWIPGRLRMSNGVTPPRPVMFQAAHHVGRRPEWHGRGLLCHRI